MDELTSNLLPELFPQLREGESNESIPKANACSLALSIPHRVDAEVSISGVDRSD